MRGLALPPGTKDSPGGRGLPKAWEPPGHGATGLLEGQDPRGPGTGTQGGIHPTPSSPYSPRPLLCWGSWVCPHVGRCCTWVMCVWCPIKSFPPPAPPSPSWGVGAPPLPCDSSPAPAPDPWPSPVTPQCCLLLPGAPRTPHHPQPPVPPKQPGARAGAPLYLGGLSGGVACPARGGTGSACRDVGAGPGGPLTPSPPTPPQGAGGAWRPPRGPGVSPQPPGRRGGGLGSAGGPGEDPRAG